MGGAREELRVWLPKGAASQQNMRVASTLGLLAAAAASPLPSADGTDQVLAPAHSKRQLVLKGERHMSTNFVAGILRAAFGDETCRANGFCADCVNGAEAEPTNNTYCCWKHGYASTSCPYSGSVPYPAHVFVLRSIYPWLISMHHNPYEYDGDHNLTFSQFIRAPFAYTPVQYAAVYRGDTGTNRQPLAHMDLHFNPIQLWNAKMRSYADFIASQKVATAFVTSPMLYDLDWLRTALRPLLQDGYRFQDGVSNIELPAFAAEEKKMSQQFTRKGFVQAREYELQQKWIELLSQEDLDYINTEVDSALLNLFGFSQVDTAWSQPAIGLSVDEHHRQLRFLT